MARSTLRRVRRGQRGATLVEYVLLVAVLALATLGGLSLIEDGAEQATGSTADRISSRTVETLPPDDGGGGGGGTSPPPTSTTTTSTTTSTTAPPPPTTTTTTPTTTVPPSATGSWGPVSTSVQYTWIIPTSWTAQASFKVTRPGGAPVAGATVTVEVQLSNGTTTTVTRTTAADGTVSFDSGSQSYWSVTQVNFVVTEVKAPGLNWSGGSQSASADRP